MPCTGRPILFYEKSLDPHWESHTVTIYLKSPPQTDSFGTRGCLGRGAWPVDAREATRIRRAVAAERERTDHRILCIGTVGYA